MRKLLLFAVVAAGSLSAQPTMTSIQTDAITRSAARVGFNVSGYGNYYLQYGLTTAYGIRTSSFGGSTNIVHQLTGMASATTYNWRICNDDYTPPTGCSANQTLVTAPDDNAFPAQAQLPALLSTTMPVINGSTFAVAANCSDLMTRIDQARTADGNLNHQVLIPPSAICTGPMDINAKSGVNANGPGVIVIRSSVADSQLPPPGVRVTRAWESAMPLFINPAIPDVLQATPPSHCAPREYYWNTSSGNGNKYAACTADNIWTNVISTSGYSSGTVKPATCTAGVYWFDTSNVTPRQALHRCVVPNRWVRLVPRGDGGYALANYYQNNLKGFRFLGLRFEPADLSGSVVANLLSIGNYSVGHSNVIVDRCIFYSGPNASSMRALDLNGNGAAIIDSFIDLRVVPTDTPYNPVANMFAISITGGNGPFKIVNNYIRGVGLLVFVNDNDNTVPRDDFEIRRNFFSYNDDYRCGSPTSDGYCRDVRAPIEFKRGRRVLVDGNIFENYWSTVGHYPGIIVSPRASGSVGFDGNAYHVSDFTITNNIFRKGGGFLEVWTGDNQGYRNTKPTERFTIRNNLFYEINNQHVSNFGGYNDARGQIIAHGSIVDTIFEHNTVYNNTGSGPAFLNITDQRAFSGLSWRSNILWLNRGAVNTGNGVRYAPGQFPDGTSPSGSTASTRLNKTAMHIPTPNYQFTHNAIVAGTTGDTAVEQGGYPSGNFWPGDSTAGEAALQFTDVATAKFRLKSTSPYRAGAANAGADGADVGVDFRRLEQAGGVVNGVQVVSIGRTQAIFRYAAPDGAACGAVDLSTSAAFASVQRFFDTQGSQDRTILATGLTPGTLYYYRVLCGSSNTSGSFTTSSVTALSTSMTLRLHPPSWSGTVSATVSYGLTAALGATSSMVVCGTECVVTIPVTLTQAIYWQANYFTLSQAPVGSSRVEVAIP